MFYVYIISNNFRNVCILVSQEILKEDYMNIKTN